MRDVLGSANSVMTVTFWSEILKENDGVRDMSSLVMFRLTSMADENTILRYSWSSTTSL